VPSLPFVTSSKGLEEFLAQYEPDQATSWVSITGQTLLHLALGNGDPGARVAIANRLLDDGADPTVTIAPEHYTTVHVLLGQNAHDAPAEAPLLERLLDAGVDVNAVAGRGRGTALQTLTATGKYSDADLAPFYDVLFARPDLDLLRPGAAGLSTLEHARRGGPTRTSLVERIEQYLRDHGQWTDDLEES
jgi:hypothetical protein